MVDGPSERGPATVGDLERCGGRLAIRCSACGRFRYMSARRYEPQERIAELGRRLHCMRCLSHDVEAQGITPDPKTGRWPAEGS